MSKKSVFKSVKFCNVSMSKKGFLICLKLKSIDSKSRKNNMRLFQVVSKEKIVSKSSCGESWKALVIESKSVFGSVVGRIRILPFWSISFSPRM